MMIKKLIKEIIFRTRGIKIDNRSDLNLSVQGGRNSKIVDSHIHVNEMGVRCFIEHAIIYGETTLGNYVSISALL